jgi:hypothetical protein
VSLFDLGADILAMITHTLTVTRNASSYDANGRVAFTPGTPFSAPAHVQPASGKDRRNLPEGVRDSAAVAVWSVVELRNGDRFPFDGGVYQVHHVDPWNTIGNYYRCVAARV